MEQQEKKKQKRKDNRRGIRVLQSKSTSSFPIDLTSEILLRLPLKSVVRFRCVSKLWSSITTDPYFINLFKTRSRPPSLLVCFRNNDNLFVSSIPQHSNTLLRQSSNKSSYSSSQPIDRYHMEFTGENNPYYPTESVHGLICFQESGSPVVWNPSKRQFLTLPKPRKSWNNLIVLLGYDPVEGKHKVVCMPLKRSSDVCRVLTLGSSAQESWRTVKTNHKHRSSFHTSGRCINGVIYYIAYIYHTRVWVVMSFDVRSEKFDMMELPPSDIHMDILIAYEGKLACVDKNYFGRLWILEDAVKHKWSSQEFLSPFGHYDESLGTYFSLPGFTHAGEFVLAPPIFRKTSYVLFYDPVRNSSRRVGFKELVDDESLLNYGVMNMQLHVFPNHIESQVS